MPPGFPVDGGQAFPEVWTKPPGRAPRRHPGFVRPLSPEDVVCLQVARIDLARSDDLAALLLALATGARSNRAGGRLPNSTVNISAGMPIAHDDAAMKSTFGYGFAVDEIPVAQRDFFRRRAMSQQRVRFPQTFEQPLGDGCAAFWARGSKFLYAMTEAHQA